MLEIADRITVIRRGRVVGERIPSETNEEDLAELMVGRNVQLTVDRGVSHAADVVLSVAGIRAKDDRGREVVRGVDLEVRAGETLGIAGVAGNGQDELVEALTGLRKPTAGSVTMVGTDVTGWSPRQLYEAGLAHVPGDRHRWAMIMSFPLEDNLVLTSYYRPPFARGPVRQDAAIDAWAQRADRAVRHPDAIGDGPGRHAVGRQPAEGGRGARVQLETRRCWCSTSRPAGSTSAASSSSITGRSRCATPVRRSCSSRRSSTRSSSCPIGSP